MMVLLQLCLLAWASFPDATALHIEKARPRPNITYMFIAGVEGAGHHFWQSVFSECIDRGKCERPSPHMRWLLNHPDMGGDVDTFRDTWRKDRQNYHGHRDVVVPLNAHSALTMLSYPNLRATFNPNLPAIVRAAEAIGAKLKVVVMTRKATDAFASITRRNKLRTEHAEAVAAKELVSQMKHLQQHHSYVYRCVRYEELSSAALPLQTFLNTSHVKFDRIIKDEFEESAGCDPCPKLTVLQKQVDELNSGVCHLAENGFGKLGHMLAVDQMPFGDWLQDDQVSTRPVPVE